MRIAYPVGRKAIRIIVYPKSPDFVTQKTRIF